MAAGGVAHHADALRIQTKTTGVGTEKANGRLAVVQGQGPLCLIGQAVVKAAYGIARIEQAVDRLGLDVAFVPSEPAAPVDEHNGGERPLPLVGKYQVQAKRRGAVGIGNIQKGAGKSAQVDTAGNTVTAGDGAQYLLFCNGIHHLASLWRDGTVHGSSAGGLRGNGLISARLGTQCDKNAGYASKETYPMFHVWSGG